MSATTQPNLAAPGAGLPAPELLIARLRFALKCRKGNRESFLAGFREEQEKIGRLVASVPESKRGEQVLIKRIRGLEDSSRYWSVWMVLDHLRIINLNFADFMACLAEGKKPGRKADTATVKPDPGVTIEIEQAFADSCEAVEKTAGKIENLKTETRHDHPWFGPLDAFQWFALASLHMSIHRAQITRIIAGR